MKVAVFPGSFDPITNGHVEIAKKGLEFFDKVIVLVADNDAKKSRFTHEERFEMTRDAFKGINGIEVDCTRGLTVDYAKKVGTKYLLRGIRNSTDMSYEKNYEEQTHKLDPSIEFKYIQAPKEYESISSTYINQLFHNKKSLKGLVPESVIKRYEKKEF